MKKIVFDKPKTVRKCVEGKKLEEIEDLSHKSQVDIVNKLYLGDLYDNKCIIGGLKRKINSYKSQDEKKERYDEHTFITLEELYEKLVISKLRCHYCRNEVKVEYNIKRDELQWTLDRIDNDLGHSSKNTLISCLKCNLQRRVTDCKKFDFTKKLRIIKENDI